MPDSNAAPTFLTPDGLRDMTGYAFSQLAVVPAGRRLVFVSGQGASGYHQAQDFAAQVRGALANVRQAMEAVGGGLWSVAEVTVLVVGFDRERHGMLTAELRAAFGGGPYPASTLIPVPRLAGDDMLVEIEPSGVVVE